MTKLAALILAVAWVTVPQPDRPCFEDMACWDCTSMGNQVCGPLAAQ